MDKLLISPELARRIKTYPLYGINVLLMLGCFQAANLIRDLKTEMNGGTDPLSELDDSLEEKV